MNFNELENMSYQKLREKYKDIVPENFPKSRVFLTRTIAYKLQEKKYGNLKIKYYKFLERYRDKNKIPKLKYELDKGQKITREYRGKTHEVFVTEKAYIYNGEEFKSLTKVAKIITGKHLSGPLFFNLRKRKHG